MAVHLLKMKRKDIENINDDFSDFSLYSPATKIRRLDADLPPIIEEDEPDFPSWINRPDDATTFGGGGVDNLTSNIKPVMSENVDGGGGGDIVLFNIITTTTTTPLPLSSSRFSIDSDILSQIKKDILSSTKHSSLVKSSSSSEDDDDDDEEGRKNTRRNECLAVVPWNPSLQQLPCTSNMQGEMEEDEQMGEATLMEIEEDNSQQQQMNDNLQQQQQQQQYCMMIPQYSSQMNDNFLQWQLQQQQQQQYQQQQQQQQLCMMNNNQQSQQSSSAPLMQMQYQWW